jgi:hypothetical protein
MRRILIPSMAFAAGVAIMAGIFLGSLAWLEGWDYAVFQFSRDRNYVIPILMAFGVQSALYAVIRLGVRTPIHSIATVGVVMAASGGTSATSMLACCLHHATSVLPILGVSATTAFLARYQRPFMQVSLLMSLAGVAVMMYSLQKTRQSLKPAFELS